jgi:hypothetical protein
MKVSFLDERDGLYIIMVDGKVKTIVRDSYSQLKYKVYNGNRIFYDFGDGLKIQETYDDRIFNCYIGEAVINIRNGKKIAEFIIDENKSGYELFVKEHYLEQHRTELLDKIIATYNNRVVKVKDGYVVDDMFKVDNKGTSYYLTGVDTLNSNWKFLCTVAQGNIRKMSIDSEVGLLELDTTCMTILAKIGFFCNPNVHDNVFMNQLPQKIQKLLVEQDKIKGGNLI